MNLFLYAMIPVALLVFLIAYLETKQLKVLVIMAILTGLFIYIAVMDIRIPYQTDEITVPLSLVQLKDNKSCHVFESYDGTFIRYESVTGHIPSEETQTITYYIKKPTWKGGIYCWPLRDSWKLKE